MSARRAGEGRGLLYRVYSSRLRRALTPEAVPHHVAMMIDHRDTEEEFITSDAILKVLVAYG